MSAFAKIWKLKKKKEICRTKIAKKCVSLSLWTYSIWMTNRGTGPALFFLSCRQELRDVCSLNMAWVTNYCRHLTVRHDEVKTKDWHLIFTRCQLSQSDKSPSCRVRCNNKNLQHRGQYTKWFHDLFFLLRVRNLAGEFSFYFIRILTEIMSILSRFYAEFMPI